MNNPPCQDCDRPKLCEVVLAGTRPCDKEEQPFTKAVANEYLMAGLAAAREDDKDLIQDGRGVLEKYKFTVKDSGERQQFDSGMVRDITEGKTDFTLVFDGPMFQRWAEHLTKGAQKYSKRNWMLASGRAELDRFKESAMRHFFQWLSGDTDEDHAAAIYFNVNGAEYVKSKLVDEFDTTVIALPGPSSVPDWERRCDKNVDLGLTPDDRYID